MTGSRDVLIVDDDDALVALIESHLQPMGFTIRAADTGERGLQAIRQRKPDLIILDIGLPDVDGRYFCELLKKDSATRHIPVLICTEEAAPEMGVSGLQMGADDYIGKPFSFDELGERAKALLRRVDIGQQRAREALTVEQVRRPLAAVSAGVAFNPDAPRVAASAALQLSPRDLLLKAWKTLEAPDLVFSSPAATGSEAVPIIAAALFGALARLLAPVVSAKVASVLLALAWPPLLWLFFSWSSLFLISLSGHKPSWPDMRRVWGLAAAPLALSALLQLLYVLITENAPGDFTSSPLLLTSSAGAAKPVLARLNIFAAWAGWLAWRGLKTLPGVSGRLAAFLAVGAWLAAFVLEAGWRIAGGAAPLP
jgi:DNA-binding response OmpR family regulator